MQKEKMIEMQPITKGRRLVRMGWVQPHVELQEKQKEIKAVMEMPGAKPEDVEITPKEGTLTIKVEVKTQHVEKEGKAKVIVMEQKGYYRHLFLPAKIKPEETQWHIEDGILEVRMAKE